MKLVVDSPSAVDDELRSVVADSAAVVRRLVVDSSAGAETVGVEVSISGGSDELAIVDESKISDEVPSDDVSRPSDVDSKLVLVASSEICSVLVLKDPSSAVLEKLKVPVEVFTSDKSSSLDVVDVGSRISDEVTSDKIVVSSDVGSNMVLVVSSGICSVLILDGSSVEMLLLLEISPGKIGSSDEVISDGVRSTVLLLVDPSEIKTTSVLVLSSVEVDVSPKALLLVDSSGDVGSGFMLPVLPAISPNEDVVSGRPVIDPLDNSVDSGRVEIESDDVTGVDGAETSEEYVTSG